MLISYDALLGKSRYTGEWAKNAGKQTIREDTMMMKVPRSRLPSHLYERQKRVRRSGKQQVHALLRENPSLTVEQLMRAVGYARGHVRAWRKIFFAPGYEPIR